MKLIKLLTVLLLFSIFAQAQTSGTTKEKKPKVKSQWINWGTWSLGYRISTANVSNFYTFSNSSNYSNPVGFDVKYSAPLLYFKVENITRYIYWNMELGLPFQKKVTVETTKGQTLTGDFQGKARFGRMINIPIAFGSFLGKSVGLWIGYNYSLYYLGGDQAAFHSTAPYAYSDRFRAGDVGVVGGSGICFHFMTRLGKLSLFRFTFAGTQAKNKAGKAKGGATETEFVYFLAFNKNNLSSGLMLRLDFTKVRITDHAFIGRFNNEATVCRSTGLSFGLCFGLPEGMKRRNSTIEKK